MPSDAVRCRPPERERPSASAVEHAENRPFLRPHWYILGAMSPREHWSRGLGFTLAAVGSAVGLGNMWRFSYMAAENGGAAFVILYVIMTLLVGLPLLLAELTVGRGAARSPVEALRHYGGKAWVPLGGLFVLTGFLILSYYGVIAGWAVRYAVEGLISGFPADAAARFAEVSTGWDAVAWHVLFMTVTILVVAGGVRSGIERAAVVLMPALGLLVVGLAIYAGMLEGAKDGYAYYFTTDFREILDFEVAKDAAGQAFFSLSLGMGAMLTYASYLSRDHDLTEESALVAVSDFGVALVVGLVIFPLIFALGLQNEVVSGGGQSTLGALFVVLPHAFAELGTAGTVIGFVFMLVLSVAAVTSSMSLLEVVVSSAIDTLGLTRRRAAWIAGGLITLLGIPSALNLGFLDLMDSLGGALFLVVGGTCLSLFVGWRMDDPIGEVGTTQRAGPLRVWLFLLRWIVPAVLAVMTFFLARDSVGKIQALLG